ncbi:MAG: hypothetical protein ACHQAQ_20235 [Hyphomicrobiales bacterium]
MTASMGGKPSDAGSRIARLLRHFAIALAGAQTVYWLYTFRLILVNANPRGDGFELVAIVPFGLVFLALVAPSLWLGATGRRLPLGVALAVAGLIVNVLLFVEIARELTGDGAHPLKF